MIDNMDDNDPENLEECKNKCKEEFSGKKNKKRRKIGISDCKEQL